jgi:hypothetical protein
MAETPPMHPRQLRPGLSDRETRIMALAAAACLLVSAVLTLAALTVQVPPAYACFSPAYERAKTVHDHGALLAGFGVYASLAALLMCVVAQGIGDGRRRWFWIMGACGLVGFLAAASVLDGLSLGIDCPG